MNRQIKFRGKDLNGNWHYGNLIVSCYGDIDDPIKYNYSIQGIKGKSYYSGIVPETVGQFTGLKDVNGKDVYELDVIEVLDSQNRPCRHIVRYSNERGCYCQFLFQAEGITVEPFDSGALCQQYISKHGKYIIGNIIDNPELLKTK